MEMHCICTAHQLCPGRSSVKQLHQMQWFLHADDYTLCSRSHVMYAFAYHLLVYSFPVITCHILCHDVNALVKGNTLSLHDFRAHQQ